MSYDHTPSVRLKRVFRPVDYVVYGALTVAQLVITAILLGYWFGTGRWGEHPLVLTVLTALLVGGLTARYMRWALLPQMRRPEPMPASPGWRVGVATTFVPGAESIKMLERTVEALVAMEYSHDTWVLDEGDSDEVRALCDRLGAYHFTRKHEPRYQADAGTFAARTKHGNYNVWFDAEAYERYDIIVGFDPDHVPDREFLLASLGYFDDPGIGYVQLPQAYYNQRASFIARGAAEETYAYYSSVQMAACGGGWPIVTGCHHLHRKTALQQVNGFAAHDADDMLIAFHYRDRGWKGVYVPEIHARGLTPVDWAGYLTQQLRWARSVLDLKVRVQPKLKSGLGPVSRIFAYVHGLSYIRGMLTLLGVTLLCWMLAFGTLPFHGVGALAGIVLAHVVIFFIADFYRQRFFLDFRNEWGLHWRSFVVQVAKWPFLVMAVVDALLNRKTRYTVTLKRSIASRNFVLVWPHATLILLIAGSWLYGVATDAPRIASLQYWAIGMSAVSALLILTELRKYPPEFDPRLLVSVHAMLARAVRGHSM